MIKNFFAGFALAFSMLSIIPFFKLHNFFSGINGYAVLNYPIVGLIVGTILYTVSLILEPFFASTHLHVIIFFLSILITGAIHLDGLSDSIDGLFVKSEKALHVMKDSNVGGMGMIFTASFLLLKASAFWHLESMLMLIPIMMISRYSALFEIFFFKYISKNGIATLAKSEFTTTQFLVATVAVTLISLFFESGLIMLFVAVATTLIIKQIFYKKIGGFSGDVYGFSIEVVELILLHVVLLSAKT